MILDGAIFDCWNMIMSSRGNKEEFWGVVVWGGRVEETYSRCYMMLSEVRPLNSQLSISTELYYLLFPLYFSASYETYDTYQEIYSWHFLHVVFVVFAKLVNKTLIFLFAAHVENHRTCDTKHTEQPVRIPQ